MEVTSPLNVMPPGGDVTPGDRSRELCFEDFRLALNQSGKAGLED